MPFDPPEPLALRRNVELFSSACPHDCPSTCALEVERLDGRTIGRVHGAKENSYTAGIVCAKVARYAERIHHPGRLTTPLRRIGAKGIGRAAFEPLSWEAALDEVAERLKRAAEKYGPETVWPYFYAGTMGLVQRDGIERLRHVMKYSRQHSTICVTLSDTGWIAGCGAKRGVDAREIAESDLVIVWGGNPVHTQVNVMHHIALARKERGAKFVVVDPYRTPTAELADIHVMPRPGTDGALAAAMMHVLFKEGYADWDYLERYTDAPRELEAHLRERTPAWASRITGLPAEEIVAFARLYGSTKRSYIRAGYGFSRSRNGSQQMHAVASLPAVTGAWRHRGGGALYGQTGIYPLDKTLIMGLDVLDPKVRVLDQSRMGPILTGDPRDLDERPAGHGTFHPEHQSGHRLSGGRQGARGLRARRSLHLRARAVHDRDRGDGRHRAARHHLPRARRFLHRERAHEFPGDQAGGRARGREPLQPRRAVRACGTPRRRASRLRHDGVGDHRQDA